MLRRIDHSECHDYRVIEVSRETETLTMTDAMLMFEAAMPALVRVLFTAWMSAERWLWLSMDTPGRFKVVTSLDMLAASWKSFPFQCLKGNLLCLFERNKLHRHSKKSSRGEGFRGCLVIDRIYDTFKQVRKQSMAMCIACI